MRIRRTPLRTRRGTTSCVSAGLLCACLSAGSILALAGCAPTVPPAPEATHVSVPTQWQHTGAAVAPPQERATSAAALATDWWRLLGDDTLNATVAQALQRNANIGMAVTQVDAARAQLALADAAALPVLNVAVNGQAARSLSGAGGRTSRSYEPHLQVAWEADLWGKLRAQSQAGQLQLDASQADLAGVQLAVAASTVQAYIGLQALKAQLALAQKTAADRLKALEIAQDRERLGYSAAAQTSQFAAELESVRQSAQQLELAASQQATALALLTGSDTPGVPPATSAQGMASLHTPTIPTVLPSALLERRPDIRAAADHLAAGDAVLTARRAAFLPQLNLSGLLGGLYTSALDYDPIQVWSLGGSLLAPLFDGKRLQSQFDLAVAQRNQAAWAYRHVVLTALSEVEQSLQNTQLLAQQAQTSALRCGQLEQALGYANDRVDAGYASTLEVLDAQRSLYQCQQNGLDLQHRALNNTIDLIKALGGGWQSPSAKAS